MTAFASATTLAILAGFGANLKDGSQAFLRFRWLRDKGLFQPSSIVDVGANRGSWTASTAKVWPGASFFMVEANEQHKAALERCRERNPPNRTRFTFRMLGDVSGNRTMYMSKQRFKYTAHTGNSLFLENKNRDMFEPRIKQMSTLDDLVAEYAIPPPDVLKIDAQGAELLVLAGASKTLASVQVLLLELAVVQYNLGAPIFFEVHAAAERLGFRAFDVSELHYTNGILIQIDIMFVRKTSRLWDRGTTGYEPPPV